MSSYADICECGHARVNHSEENCGHCFSEERDSFGPVTSLLRIRDPQGRVHEYLI